MYSFIIGDSMKSKGFTLVEIIVCLVLITLIGTISVISINNSNKKEKEEAKLISTVTNAANVYYSMNNDLKQKLKDNYGYLVVSIEDLKNNGYLDKNYIVPNSDDKDYSKMVIVERDISNGFRLLSNENNDDEIGYIDYIYPYEENVPFIINLEGLTIENFEKEKLDCTSGLTNGKLDYLDKNYEKQSTENFECKYYKYNNNDLTIENNEINRSSLSAGNYTMRYKVNNEEITKDRMLTINDKPNFALYINDNQYETKNYYFNGDVKLSIEDTKKGAHELYIKSQNDSEFSNENNFITLKNENINTTKTFEGSLIYKIKGKLSDEYSKETTLNYNNITIDRENPSIEKTDYINQEITIKDNGSGIKLYKIDDKKYNSGFSTEPSQSITIKPNKEKFDLYIKDNAGNEVSKVISLKNE